VGPAEQGGEVYYLHGDHLGSTSLATSEAGEELYRRGYYPFGEERYGTGAAQTDYGFTGQREEAYIDLIEMGARWYDSSLGRWLTADSIVPDPGNPQSLNRYSYVYNNPVMYVDPTGHSPWYTIDGQPVSYWLDGPTSDAETADEPADHEPDHVNLLRQGRQLQSVYMGDLPWEQLVQGAPRDPTPLGLCGLFGLLLEAFVTYARPFAGERYWATQEPNVDVTVGYRYEEEGLLLTDITVYSVEAEALKVNWFVDFRGGNSSTHAVQGGPYWSGSPGTPEWTRIEVDLAQSGHEWIDLSGHISPYADTTVTVWLYAQYLDPPQIQEVVFSLPGQR
jgi:RHS repeat-associated protein